MKSAIALWLVTSWYCVVVSAQVKILAITNDIHPTLPGDAGPRNNLKVLKDFNAAPATKGTVAFVELSEMDPNNVNYLVYDMFVVVGHGMMGADGMPEVAGGGRKDWKLRRLWGILSKKSMQKNVLITYMPCNYKQELGELVLAEAQTAKYTQESWKAADRATKKTVFEAGLKNFKKLYVPSVKVSWVRPATKFSTNTERNLFMVYKTYGLKVWSTGGETTIYDNGLLKDAVTQFYTSGMDDKVLGKFKLSAMDPFTVTVEDEWDNYHNQGMLGFQFQDISTKNLMDTIAGLCNLGTFSPKDREGVKTAAAYLPYSDNLETNLENVQCDQLETIHGHLCNFKKNGLVWGVSCRAKGPAQQASSKKKTPVVEQPKKTTITWATDCPDVPTFESFKADTSMHIFARRNKILVVDAAYEAMTKKTSMAEALEDMETVITKVDEYCAKEDSKRCESARVAAEKVEQCLRKLKYGVTPEDEDLLGAIGTMLRNNE